MSNIKRVMNAMAELKAIETRVEKIAEFEYPVGSQISWERGRGVQHGVVLTTSFHHTPRFRVRNDHSGKTYWIDFYNVVCAAGDTIRDEYLDRAA